MAEPGGQKRKNTNGASTMETLMHFGIEELKRSGSIEFNLENVLRESGVSRGSLYHHFGNRHGLISHCEAQVLKESLKSENEFIRLLIESGQSGEELFTMLGAFIQTMGSEPLVQQRSRRIRTLAASMEDPKLRAMIAGSQIRGSRYLAESYEIAAQKGLLQPVIDIETIVYVTQALFLGRVLVDIADQPELSDSVNKAIVLVLRNLMNPQE